jgi:hypothetical protein
VSYQVPLSLLESLHITKYELAKRMGLQEKYHAFDTALPQQWLNEFCKSHNFPYDMVLFSTFWCYLETSLSGIPVSCCVEFQAKIDEVQ